MKKRSPFGKLDVIDLVAMNAAGDEVIVYILATAPWHPRGKDTQRLQTKLETAVSFVADGQLEREYPEVAGLGRRIHIRTDHPLGESEQALVEAAAEHWCEPEGIVLSWSDGIPTKQARGADPHSGQLTCPTLGR